MLSSKDRELTSGYRDKENLEKGGNIYYGSFSLPAFVFYYLKLVSLISSICEHKPVLVPEPILRGTGIVSVISSSLSQHTKIILLSFGTRSPNYS